MLRHVIDIYSG